MPSERSQFRILCRDFLQRIVDLEVLSSGGEIQKLLIQFAAMLAAFSFVLTIWIVPPMARAPIPHEKLLVAAWSVEEFLVASTMALTGLFAVLAWNTVLPDRRDCFVLGLLPVRTRTVFLAKTAAMAAALGVSVGAANLFTGLSFPFVLGGLRTFAAYWMAMLAAAIFVFCALLAVQGVLALCLSYRLFLRVSSWVQLTSFFAILGIYFLKPPFHSTAQSGWPLPSFWFFGLFQALNGAADPAFGALAARAGASLLIAFAAAAASFGLAYRRNLRRIVEQPDIAPADRSRPATRIGVFLAARLLSRPIERAIVLFIARTIARSRQHRLLLAAYAGIGLAVALAYARDLLYGSDSIDRLYFHARWNQVNGPFLVGSLVMLFFAIIGTRAAFAMPIALGANWIFRVTAVHSPAAYFAAARKSLFAVAAAPVCLIAAAFYFAIWPAWPAAQHVAVLIAVSVLTIELSLYRFHKMPFACSYLPGKANLHVRLGAGGIAFLFVASQGVQLEYWAMERPVRFLVFLSILAAWGLWARHRTAAFSNLPGARIQFEDLPPAELTALNLSHDAAGADDVYLDTAGYVEREPFRFETVLQDLRYGARILTKAPGFSAAAVALIAIGIGGNTAIFSMIHGILTKPAPGVRGDGVVTLGIMINGQVEIGNPSDSYLNYLDYADQSRTLRPLAALRPAPRFTLGLAGGTYEVRGQFVTANIFETLGVPLVRGRTFSPEEMSGAAPLAAILAWHVWQNQFQGADNVIGQSILLNGQPATVVGVTAPKFAGPLLAPTFEVGVPLNARSPLARRGLGLDDRAARGVEMIGRLARRASLGQAQAEFDMLSRRLQEEWPEANQGRSVILAPYAATVFGTPQGSQPRAFMGILMAVALITLLIVCANVANLMLARATARQREMAVRQSLGASHARIFAISLSEGLVLSIAGCMAAWLFATWACRGIVKFVPPLDSGARMELDLSPDWSVAAYALLLAVAAALTFTLLPAIRTWRQDLIPWLKAGEQGVIQGRSRLAGVLVVAQLAFCCLLLTSAGLAWRSISLMDATDLYFTKDHLLLAAVNTSATGGSPQQNLDLLERIRRRLTGIPGVVSASYAQNAPPRAWTGVALQTKAPSPPLTTDVNFVGPDYLAALGVPILSGRGIVEGDLTASAVSVVVNQKLASTLWPNQSPLGRTLALADSGQPLQVVGVVPNGAFSGIGQGGGMTGIRKEDRGNFLFLPESMRQAGPGETTFHVRYAGSLEAVAPAIRAAIQQADHRVPVYSLQTMDAAWASFTSLVHLLATLLEVFAAGALILASLGLYAVAAFATARRTREFGIRMALGATPRQTLNRVLREGLALTAAGIVFGLALSLAAGKAFGSLLYGVTPTDLPTWCAVLALLAAVSLLACYVPARRAASVDPTQALRQD